MEVGSSPSLKNRRFFCLFTSCVTLAVTLTSYGVIYGRASCLVGTERNGSYYTCVLVLTGRSWMCSLDVRGRVANCVVKMYLIRTKIKIMEI